MDSKTAIKTLVNISAPEFPSGEGGFPPDRNGTLGFDNMEVMVSASIPGHVLVQAWDTDLDPEDEEAYAVVIEFTPEQARDLAARLIEAAGVPS
jgi:hypothetical protein